MPADAPSGWHRTLRRLVSKVAGRRRSTQVEILRQMGDVFKELAHLSVDIGAVYRSLDETKAAVSQLTDSVIEQTEVGNETIELLGRLLQSARARLDALEEQLGQR